MLRQQRYLGFPIGKTNPADDPVYTIRNIEDNSVVNHPLMLNESYKGILQGTVNNLPLYGAVRSCDSEIPGRYKGLHYDEGVHYDGFNANYIVEGRESVPLIGVLTIPNFGFGFEPIWKTRRIDAGPHYQKSRRWNCYGPNTLTRYIDPGNLFQTRYGPSDLVLERLGPTVEPNSLGCPRVPTNWQFYFPWQPPSFFDPVFPFFPQQVVTGGTHILRPSFDFNTNSRWGEWPTISMYFYSNVWLELDIYNSQGIGAKYEYWMLRDSGPAPGGLQDPFEIWLRGATNPGENWPQSITISPDDGHEKYKNIWYAFDGNGNPIFYFDKYKFTLTNMVDPFMNRTHIIESTPTKGWVYPVNCLNSPLSVSVGVLTPNTAGICQLTFENE